MKITRTKKSIIFDLSGVNGLGMLQQGAYSGKLYFRRSEVESLLSSYGWSIELDDTDPHAQSIIYDILHNCEHIHPYRRVGHIIT